MPLTTNVGRLYPSEALVVVNRRQNKAMADQLTTVSKLRLIDRAGRLTSKDMLKVEQAIKVQLAFKGSQAASVTVSGALTSSRLKRPA